MRWPRREMVSQHEPVLGTVLTLHTAAWTAGAAARADRALLAELDRLTAVFSVFDPTSELSRWRAAPDELTPGSELRGLLELGLRWQAVGGLFNPAVGVVTERWKRAERDGVVPSSEELAGLAAAIAEPSYALSGGRVMPTGNCSMLNFNALAKGLAIDLATRTVFARRGIARLVVNVGGDLRHVGAGAVSVGVENPRRPYDNEPPLAVVSISNQGMATSGGARRGFRVGERWFSHVIDPRTAQPVDRVASASVFAHDAATADVVATLLSVAEPSEGLALVAAVERDGVLVGGGRLGCCVVDRDGGAHTNASWDAQTISAGGISVW